MLTFEHWTLYYNKYIATMIGGKQMTTLHWQQTKFTVSLKLYITKVSRICFSWLREKKKTYGVTLSNFWGLLLANAKHLHKTVPAM